MQEIGRSEGWASRHGLRAAISSSIRTTVFGTKPALVILALALLFSAYALADGGAEIYKAKCSACHGASGAGDTMLGRNMTLRALGSDEVQRQSDEELASITSRGKNKMPAYDRKLSKDQIAAVVKFIRSLKK